MAASKLRALIDANEGNLDLTLRIRGYSLLNTYTAQAAGEIIPEPEPGTKTKTKPGSH